MIVSWAPEQKKKSGDKQSKTPNHGNEKKNANSRRADGHFWRKIKLRLMRVFFSSIAKMRRTVSK